MSVDYPWRPLGELLVEGGVIDAYELEYALAEQRLSGMLLGEVVVARGLASAIDVAAAIAVQHGVSVGAQRPSGERPKSGPVGEGRARRWRPLGRILVETDRLTESGLLRALIEQRRQGGMLGEILLRRGYVSAPDLAAALAEQHGLDVDEGAFAEAQVIPLNAPAAVYEVREPEGEPLHTSPSFLDAADFAFDLLDERDPEQLEIVRVDRRSRTTEWSYSRKMSEAVRGQAGRTAA